MPGLQLTQQQLNFVETFGYLHFPGLLNDRINRIIEAFEQVWVDLNIEHNNLKRSARTLYRSWDKANTSVHCSTTIGLMVFLPACWARITSTSAVTETSTAATPVGILTVVGHGRSATTRWRSTWTRLPPSRVRCASFPAATDMARAMQMRCNTISRACRRSTESMAPRCPPLQSNHSRGMSSCLTRG